MKIYHFRIFISQYPYAIVFGIVLTLTAGCNLSSKHESNGKDLELNMSDLLSQAILYHSQGSDYQKNDSLQQAVELYDKALSLISGDSSAMVMDERAKILVSKGSIFFMYDDYETAYSLFLEAEELFLNTKHYNRLINLY